MAPASLAAQQRTRDLVGLAETNRRAYSRRELEERFSRGALRSAVAQGAVVSIARGVYCAAMHAQSYVVRVDGAVKCAGPQAAATGVSALYLWRALEQPPGSVAVSLPHEAKTRRVPTASRVTRTRHERELFEIDGIRVVSPELAALDAWRLARPAERDSLLWVALATRVVDAGRLHHLAASRHRLPGRARLLRIVSDFARGAESPLEAEAMHEVFTSGPLLDLERQVDVRVADRRYRLDTYHRPSRTAFECDGQAYHVSPERWRDDRERDTNLATLGILTVRFTYRDIVDRPAWCRERALEVIAART